MLVCTKAPAPLQTTDPLLLSPPISKPKKPKLHNLFIPQQNQRVLLKTAKHVSSSLSATNFVDSSNLNSQISNMCLQGRLQEALQLLGSSEELVDEETLISLLRLCQFERSISEGSRVYAHINCKSAVKCFSRKLGNALLSIFVHFGNLLEAWLVFGRMEERDIFSWNVMLGGYAKAGFFDEALNLYYQMLWVGIRPDLYTFPCVLRTCAGIPDLVRGREIHVHVVRFGYESEIDVTNALITMYAKCGDIRSARRLFDGITQKDLISWNAVISGYIENGRCLQGLELFSMMQARLVDPDAMTMTSVISACEVVSDMRLGMVIHGFVTKTGFVHDVSVCNSLIHMYVGSKKLEEAEQIFVRMESKDVISWTAMISGYEKNFFPSKAVEAYEKMKLERVEPDEVTLASVLSACSCLGLLDRGIELHELARKRRILSYPMVANMLIDMYSKCKRVDKAMEIFRRVSAKNVITWTSMILGFRINGRSFEALNVFRKMLFELSPNIVTLVVVLSACSKIGASTCGKEIHAYALRNGLAFEDFLPNAILDMYVKCGRIEIAEKQFKIHGSKDVTSWNILLSGYARQGYGSLAIGLFNQMIETGVDPNDITFLALLCACSRSGMVSEGQEYFNSISQQYNIIPNLKHYTCMVDLLGRSGHLKEAHEFIQQMPIKPDAGVWGALLNACRLHRQVELGQLAAQSIFEMDSQSAGYYVLLCNLYADNGRWDEVARVRKLMREGGLFVDPGCSWVEVKGAVNAFLSGDESHPKIKEIHAILDGFYARMRTEVFDSPESSQVDVLEMSKAEIFCGHSERLAVGFALINTIPGTPISVTKNLYMCSSCHNTVKFISRIVRREITVRDTEQFHHFKDGTCSCGDKGYWGRRI
ncbi:pentatricopeptide repeat-containing protein At1g15510, chloroplastic-like [Aristolochia californica]|uniref:pentatricopeptide repeat-containing protein At1g15510, chloroplastic-like n=1 Tax=Aristolochia californica TaxID=171875 RepID=UPI0035D951EE